MRAFPVKVIVEDHAAGNTWLLVCEDCPLSAKIHKQVPCMSGAYYSDGSMVRLGPVCDYTKEDACSRDFDGPRTHQHCWHDEGGIPGITLEEHVKFGHAIIRHATPEEMAARIADELGETEHHYTKE